jgi:hypothetical protein
MMWILGKVLGCPCCGPRWYAALAVRWHQRHGYPVPPELGGEYSQQEGR